MDRRDFLARTAAGIGAALFGEVQAAEPIAPTSAIDIEIDFMQCAGSFPHYWEYAGSDRAAIGQRAQWRDDLVAAVKATGIRQVRCHGLFDDEMGIAAQGSRTFNFLYLDQVYDFMLDQGVRPFVELGFMPDAYARRQGNRIFAYQGNASPPRDWRDWYDLLQAFARHCIDRYGLREVQGWKFEVWNEPNLTFWSGTQAEYFELYRQSALALKEVDSQLQVGDPATAQLQWVPDLIAYCDAQKLPLDFVSTHVYPSDPQTVLFGSNAQPVPFEQVMPRGLERVRDQVAASARPRTPVWLTEWSSQNPAFIADTIKNCLGRVEAMSYWTFSNVFEEGGVPRGIFNGTFGMTDQWGIKRPSFNTFALLHTLGETQLCTGTGPILATRRADGSHALLLWNLIPVRRPGVLANGNPLAAGGGASGGEDGAPLTVRLKMRGLGAGARARTTEVNDLVGSALPTWKHMGSPAYPSRAQLQQLRDAAELPAPRVIELLRGANSQTLSITLPRNGIALIELI